MANKLYKIEYGKSVFYKSAKRGETYHITRPLTRRQTIIRQYDLNKKWDYTTVLKLKGNKWKELG